MKLPPFLLTGMVTSVIVMASSASAIARTTLQDNPDISLQAPPSVLDKEAALAVVVSFEAKGQPLGELLGELQKQSGVHLTVHENFGPQVRVTARVADLPLSAVMNALSRLYQAEWVRGDEKTYVLTPRQISDWEKQMGELHWFRFRDKYSRSADNLLRRGDALSQAIRQEVAPAILHSPQGVPVLALSGEIQDELRRYFAETVGKEIIASHLYKLALQKQDWELRVQLSPEMKKQVEVQNQNLPPKTSAFALPTATILDSSGVRIIDVPLMSVAPTQPVVNTPDRE